MIGTERLAERVGLSVSEVEREAEPVLEGEDLSLGVAEVEALLDCDEVVDSEELFGILVDWLGEREGLPLPVSEGDEVSLGVTEVEALLDCDLVVDSEELFDALVDWLGEREGLQIGRASCRERVLMPV